MKLDEFVRETLVQIVNGTKAAQQEIAKLGGSVHPRMSAIRSLDSADETGLMPEIVEFDVALTTTDSMSSEGGGKVGISVFSVGVTGESGSSSQATNRVRFKVPVVLPADIGFGKRHLAMEQAKLAEQKL